MASTGSFAEHLEPGLREIVGTRLGGRQSFYSQLLNVETSKRNFEDYLYAAPLPIAVQKNELSPIQSYDPLEGSTKRVSHTVYAIGFEVSEEAWEDDLYAGKGSALRAAGEGLSDSLAELVEVQGHRFFNAEAFATSSVADFLRTLPDNSATVSLFNTAHGPVAGGEAAAQTNRSATDADLTVTSYRTGLTQFKQWRDDRNKRMPGFTDPAKLLVPVEEEFNALEITGSRMRPDTANEVDNVTRGRVQVIADPYLDGVDDWFLIGRKHWMTFLWRWRPRMDSFDDRRTRAAVMVAYQRFGIIAVAWQGVYGSQGS